MLPPDQTVEGGGQIRVTQQGFTKLTSALPGLLNNQLGGGFCVPQGQFGSLGTFGTGAKWCYTNANGCSPGCKANVSINPGGFAISVPNSNTMNVRLSTTLSTRIPVTGQLVGVGLGSCTLFVTSNNLNGDFDIGFGVKPANGELDVHLRQINSFQLNMDFSGCGIFSSIANLAGAIIDSFLGQFLIGLLTPAIDGLLQGMLPNPLGLEGMVDVGSLLAGVSPGTEGEMEARFVPGGYVNLVGNGMSLGLITGLNSDEDPASRTPALDSEPALCVPPMDAPDFRTAGLPQVFRSAFAGNTFSLAPAGQFAGGSDPAADLAMGISETTLDLAGHHLVTSGGMCLGVGTSYVKQLNVGTIGILVPSLAELESDKGNDPLLLVTRPQRALDFTIGDNTDASPALTIGISHLEVDFYAFLYERYVRAFTLDLSMNVGVNLTFEQPPSGPALIHPTLVGISSESVTVKVLNSQFVSETPAHLEAVLPSVFDLVTPLLGNLPPIQVPSFAGFNLQNLSIQHVTTSQDDFLALYADMGPGVAMRTLAGKDPLMAQAVHQMDLGLSPAPATSDGHAKLRDVHTPEAQVIRDALLKVKGGALPSVTFDLDRTDSAGRALEWQWNLNGGLWRPYTRTNQLVISDRAFAWQGKYEIGLRSRVVGDYRTTSEIIRTPVVIDSVGPNIFPDKLDWDGDELKVPAWDVVDGHDIEVAYGKVGEDGPSTKWVPWREGSLAKQTAMHLLDDHGEILMFARDALGNQSIAMVAPFHGQAGSGGCSCESGRTPSAGSLVLIGLVGFGLFGRRRRRWAKHVGFVVGIGVLSAFVPACNCGKNQGKSCETAADCGPDFCPKGMLPFCIDNECVCSDDIPPGRIGPYSDVAFGGGTAWVSAYASSHGDLVVAQATSGRIPDEAWEWVDGVPDGPVIVPDSKIRRGIDEAGPDVGMYTSIAVAPDGTPEVSYFDRDTGSLKFAARVGGVWQTHVVEAGTGKIDASGGSLVGMYTSLTLRTDDGRPGIAYLAHVADGTGEHAEVRYAAAQTAVPSAAGDWQFWKVDTAPVPENPDEIYPLPGGLGLFVDSARNPQNQAPVVVYYDRSNGDLKEARFNPASGQFSAPVILDGSNGVDAGWTPSVTVDANGVAHVAYVNASHDDLMYITDNSGATKETVDNGYRIVGTTVDGLPKPEFHFVGDDAGIVLPPGGLPMVVYQDSTTQELMLAQRDVNGYWQRFSIAGATDPWPGAYGFFAAAALTSDSVVMSTWVIDQPTDENWVEVFSKPFVIQ